MAGAKRKAADAPNDSDAELSKGKEVLPDRLVKRLQRLAPVADLRVATCDQAAFLLSSAVMINASNVIGCDCVHATATLSGEFSFHAIVLPGKFARVSHGHGEQRRIFSQLISPFIRWQ